MLEVADIFIQHNKIAYAHKQMHDFQTMQLVLPNQPTECVLTKHLHSDNKIELFLRLYADNKIIAQGSVLLF